MEIDLIKCTEDELNAYKANSYSSPQIIAYYEQILAVLKGENKKTDKTDVVDKEIQCGTLKKPIGLNSYIRCEVGHPVFETRDKYIIYHSHVKLEPFRQTFYKTDDVVFVQEGISINDFINFQ